MEKKTGREQMERATITIPRTVHGLADTPLMVRVNQHRLEQYDQAAERIQVSRSEWVRVVLDWASECNLVLTAQETGKGGVA